MILQYLGHYLPPSQELPVNVFNLGSYLLSIFLIVCNFNLVYNSHRCFFIALLLHLSVSLVFSIQILSWFVVGFEFLKVGFNVGC